MKRYKILKHENINGKSVECLCYDAGCAIVYGEDKAQARVAKLHSMGYTDARYEESPVGSEWFDDNNWIN